MIVWTEQAYGTGVPEIDAQHRELFDRVNAVVGMSENGHDVQELERTLDYLARYVVEHFVFEEAWMAEHNCPGQEANTAGHTRFVSRLTSFQHRFPHEGETSDYQGELSRFLTRWLSNHVEVIDVQNMKQPATA
ncbi:MAG: hemerythrin family protein [Proteobacteria bacterium]|nr:hemerythrin family protein [Pseudomonadota bacterium]